MLNFSILVMVTVFVFLLPEGEMLRSWRFLVILFVVLGEAIKKTMRGSCISRCEVPSGVKKGHFFARKGKGSLKKEDDGFRM
jgi:hypothetical protein